MLLDAFLHSKEKGTMKLQWIFENIPNILTADDRDSERMAVQTNMIDDALGAANREVKNNIDSSQNNAKSKLLVLGSTPTHDMVRQRPK